VLQLLRRNRDFRTLFLAQLISYGGDWFATVAILSLVRDRTDSDLLVPLVFVSQALPAFFLSPFAGPVADRFDRRMVMIVVSTAQVLAALIFLGALEGRCSWSSSRRRASVCSVRSSVRRRRPRYPIWSTPKTFRSQPR
jgi:MFS family permease